MPAIKVLVVNDNEAHASGLAELLRLWHFEATYVTTGIQALSLLAEQAVDAVLLGVHLRDLSGYEVCRRLRLRASAAHVAVVFHVEAGDLVSGPHVEASLLYAADMEHTSSVIRESVARRRKMRTVRVS